VNGIIARSGFGGDKCQIWPLPGLPGFGLFRAIDRTRLRLGVKNLRPWALAAQRRPWWRSVTGCIRVIWS